jgi:serine/threonine-protein kinase
MTRARDHEPEPPFESLWDRSGLAAATAGLAPRASLRGARATADTLPASAASRSIAELPLIPLCDEGAPADTEYVVGGVLGEGGMGRVLLVRQRSLGREVAVKVAREEAASASAEALVAEARITGALEHPNIVPVHALGRDADGRPVLVMKRVDGVAWSELLRDAAHPAWRRILGVNDDRSVANLEVLMKVCDAVHFAHTRGVVHRDLKPENVLIGELGEVYVVDWGIAARPAEAPSAPAELVGTPAYLAPEMLRCSAREVDARTDVYLLGAVLHELVTGRCLHDAPAILDALRSAYESAPFAYEASVPPELAGICARATRREPDERFPSALELHRALADFVRHRGSIAIATAATARLAELVSMAERAGSSPDAGALAKIAALETECRFGFTQALQGWGANDVAREGQQRCIRSMATFALARGNADEARVRIAELAEPAPELTARLDALDAELRVRGDRLERLERIERDMDFSVSARQRSALFAFAAAILTAIAIVFIRAGRTEGAPVTHRGLVIASATLLALVVSGVIAGRRRILATQANRGLVGFFVVACSGIFAHRSVEAYLVRPAAGVLTIDMLLVVVIAAFGAVTVTARLAWVALVFAVGTVVGTISPAIGAPLFFPCMLIALGLLMRIHRTRSPGGGERS